MLYVSNPYKKLIGGIHLVACKSKISFTYSLYVLFTLPLLKMIGIKILKVEFTFYFLLQVEGEGE